MPKSYIEKISNIATIVLTIFMYLLLFSVVFLRIDHSKEYYRVIGYLWDNFSIPLSAIFVVLTAANLVFTHKTERKSKLNEKEIAIFKLKSWCYLIGALIVFLMASIGYRTN